MMGGRRGFLSAPPVNLPLNNAIPCHMSPVLTQQLGLLRRDWGLGENTYHTKSLNLFFGTYKHRNINETTELGGSNSSKKMKLLLIVADILILMVSQ